MIFQFNLCTNCLQVLSVSTLTMNSMSLSCLLFSHVLPLAKTEMFLVETHNDTMHAVAPETTTNETDQKSVGSNKEVGQRLAVGQDYSHGCWKCGWRVSSYCKWVAIVAIVPSLKLSYTLPILTLMLYTCTHAVTDIF